MNPLTVIPDVANPSRAPVLEEKPIPSAFAQTLDGLSADLKRADAAEEQFAAGGGDMQAAIYERARADIAIAVASSVAQRAVGALQTIVNMQV